MEHGVWSMEHGAWGMEHGAWSMEHPGARLEQGAPLGAYDVEVLEHLAQPPEIARLPPRPRLSGQVLHAGCCARSMSARHGRGAMLDRCFPPRPRLERVHVSMVSSIKYKHEASSMSVCESKLCSPSSRGRASSASRRRDSGVEGGCAGDLRSGVARAADCGWLHGIPYDGV